jgi:hypothetical protein
LFKKLTTEDQLRLEREKNLILLSRQIELEDALIEVAEIVANNEEAIQNG